MAEEAQVVEQVTPTPEVEAEETKAEETGDQVENQEESTTSEDGDDSAETKRQNKGVGKRINELTREKYEAMRKAEEARAEAEYWRQQAANPRQEPADTKPDINDYQSFEDYNEALAEWKFEQKMKERDAKAQLSEQERTLAEKAKEQAKAWEAREKAARDELDDYDEVVIPLLSDPKILYHPGIGEALAASDIGPKILHYLGQNLPEAMAIAQMSPPAAAKAIGRIEAKLESQTKPKSSAPTPPKPVKPAVKPEGLRDDLPVDEWVKERNKQLYGSRR